MRLLRRWLFYLLLGSLWLLLTYIAQLYPLRLDISTQGKNSLAPASVALLEKLDQPLAITAAAPDYPVLRARIKDLVQLYQLSYPDTHLNFLDPTTHPGQARQLGIDRGNQLIIEYQGRSEKVTGLSEQAISNTIARLALGDTQWILGISGHGEASLAGKANYDLGRFGQLLETSGYKVVEFNLLETGSIPDNTVLLVLAAPRSEMAASEVNQIIEYLNKGGSLLWLAEGELPADLLAYLDLQALPGTVVDAAAAELGLDQPTIAIASNHPPHTLTDALNGPVLLPGSRAFAVADIESSWRVETLLRTGHQSWNETGEIKGKIRQDSDDGEHTGPMNIAVVLTRQLDAKKQQRVIVTGDSDFLSNAYLGNASNRAFGLAMVHWLGANETLLEVPPQTAADVAIQWQPKHGRGAVFLFLLILPLLLAVSGIIIHLRRKRA